MFGNVLVAILLLTICLFISDWGRQRLKSLQLTATLRPDFSVLMNSVLLLGTHVIATAVGKCHV